MALLNHRPNTVRDAPTVTTASSSTEKIALFRRLFAGRPDVFPRRWEKAECRRPNAKALDAALRVADDQERLILATGRYIGEGFDDPRLDALFLTMPISWKGTLAQYVGRLHRQHAGKTEVLVVDNVDDLVPILARMAAKRDLDTGRSVTRLNSRPLQQSQLGGHENPEPMLNGMHFDEIQAPKPEFCDQVEQ
jgi:superfamily II DNA or RNA helicase